jgi:uncharacterized protein YjdB
MRSVLYSAAVVTLVGVLAACSSSPTDPPPEADGPTGALVVAPSAATITPGDVVRLAASVGQADGNRWAPFDIVWQSTDPTIATVAFDGVVQGLKPGEVHIVASWQGTASFAHVTVLESVTQVPLCLKNLSAKTAAAGVPQGGDCR